MKTGYAIGSDQVATYKPQLFRLPVLALDDFLITGFPDQAQARLPEIKQLLAGYGGEIVVAGPHVDLNPGSPDRLVIEVVQKRYEQALAFAAEIGAREIMFLSSFIPIIGLAAYEDPWVSGSIQFWKSFMDAVSPSMTVSLANLFEFRPEFMLRVVEGVGHPNFKITLELGHFLVYSKIGLVDWLQKIAAHCSTVYVHSNNGQIDTHDEPYRGVLKREDIALIGRMLAPDTRLIVQVFNKSAIAECIAWVEEALHGG
jgi:sugar phosphate isomerase/epimerase